MLFSLGGYFFKRRTVLYFFLKTGKSYRLNSFCIVIYAKFVKGQTFFSFRSWPMTSSPYSVHVIGRIFNLGNHSQVIPQKTPKTLLSSFLTLFRSYSTFLLQFSTKQYITKIHCKYLMTSLWRNRIWPEAEKSLALYKFCIDYDAKRIK